MSKKMILLLVLLAVAFGVWKLVTSFKKGGQRSDAAVEHFHAFYNGGGYANIYQEASPAFQQVGTEQTFVSLLGSLKSKVGMYRSSVRTGLRLDTTNGHTTMQAGYASQYEKGPVTETFLFDYDGDQPILMHYGVESPLLLK